MRLSLGFRNEFRNNLLLLLSIFLINNNYIKKILVKYNTIQRRAQIKSLELSELFLGDHAHVVATQVKMASAQEAFLCSLSSKTKLS